MNFAAPALMITLQQEYHGQLWQKKLARDLRNNVAQNGVVASSLLNKISLRCCIKNFNHLSKHMTYFGLFGMLKISLYFVAQSRDV